MNTEKEKQNKLELEEESKEGGREEEGKQEITWGKHIENVVLAYGINSCLSSPAFTSKSIIWLFSSAEPFTR